MVIDGLELVDNESIISSGKIR